MVDEDFFQSTRIIEAALLAADAPLRPKDLAALLPNPDDINRCLGVLKDHYSHRGITLVERGGLWAFRTAADLSPYLEPLRQQVKKLPRVALEVLSIIAYHQPVTRADIEHIRGTPPQKNTFDLLLEQGWIKPGPRREVPGHPGTWVTTPAFLDHFGLETLKELPGLESFVVQVG